MVEVGLAMGLYGMDNSRIVNNTVVPAPGAADSEIRLTNQKDGNPSSNNAIRNNLAHRFNTGAATTTDAPAIDVAGKTRSAPYDSEPTKSAPGSPFADEVHSRIAQLRRGEAVLLWNWF
jgi:hypothetical protein